jgi:thiamine biosynthesis protein ThiS
MEIIVNGTLRQVPNETAVADLLEILGIADRRLALEVNQEIIPRSIFATQRLQPGDRVEIVQAIGGG